MMAFERLIQKPFKTKSSAIADQLLKMIRTGTICVGDKLPPERLIAEQTGASRPSVREAISALQIGGIVETRPGDGTYVIHIPAPDNGNGPNPAIVVLEKSDSPHEILQARRAVEIGVVRFAVEVALDQDLDGLENAWRERLEKGRRYDFEAYTLCGKQFHMAIARATRNRVIIDIMDRLLDAMQQPLWVNMRKAYYQADPSRIDLMLEVHDDIVGAIIDRNADTAVRAIEADFDHVQQQLYGLYE